MRRRRSPAMNNQSSGSLARSFVLLPLRPTAMASLPTPPPSTPLHCSFYPSFAPCSSRHTRTCVRSIPPSIYAQCISSLAFAHILNYRGRARASVPLFLSSLIPPFLPRARAYNVLYSICDLYHSFVFPISSARNVLLPFAGGFKEDSKSFHSNSLCPFFYPSTLISDDFFLF